MDGEYNGTTFTDSSASAHSPTRVGALTKTSEKKFGTASAYFDGDSYLTYSASADFQLTNSGDFTVDFWFNIGGTASTSQHLFQIFGADSDHQWSVYLSGGNKPCLYSANGSSTGAARITAADAVATSTWHHLSVVRSGSTVTLYVNGTSVGTTTTTVFPDAPTLGLVIARQNFSPTWQQYLYGYIDDFRVTKGDARWTADFTPPTFEFPTQGLGVFSIETLPIIEASGTGHGSWFANSDVPLFAITATGTGYPGGLASSTVTIPAIQADGSGGESPKLPMIVAEGHGVVGVIGGSDVELQPVEAAGHGVSGVLGTSYATLPSLEGVGYGPPISIQTLPSITGSASGLTGQVGRSESALRVISGAGAGSVPIVGRSSQSLLQITLAGSGHSSVIGASSVTLKSLIVASSGVSGRLGSSTVTLPVILADGSGHVQVVGSSTVTLPSIIASGTSAITVGATYQGYALQTQAQALTTYSEVPFNSFARFNNVYLAAGPGGLFVLEGDTDAGTWISAAARVGVTDFGESVLKHVDAMYVNYRTDGELALKVITDETDEYDYPLLAHGGEALNTTRARVGRGAKGVYWQFEIYNIEGADFDFDRIEPIPLKMTRRIA